MISSAILISQLKIGFINILHMVITRCELHFSIDQLLNGKVLLSIKIFIKSRSCGGGGGEDKEFQHETK